MKFGHVSCPYEKNGMNGINEEVPVEEYDVLLKFLHPIDPYQYILIGLQLKLNAGCQ